MVEPKRISPEEVYQKLKGGNFLNTFPLSTSDELLPVIRSGSTIKYTHLPSYLLNLTPLV